MKIIDAVTALCLASPAGAAEQAAPIPCAPLKLLLDRLAANFHEAVVLTGEAAGKHLIVTVSDGGTFSILITDGNVACMIAAGEKAELDKGI